MLIKATVIGLIALSMSGFAAGAKEFNCTEGYIGGLRLGAKPLATIDVTGYGNFIKCNMACNEKVRCKAYHVLHTSRVATMTDKSTCVLFGTTSVSKISKPVIFGQQWSQLCIQK
jgi:hypothetical protein